MVSLIDIEKYLKHIFNSAMDTLPQDILMPNKSAKEH